MIKNLYDQLWDDIGKYDLMVIRGHLIIEELLNKIIKLLAENSTYLLKQQVNFSTKVAVVRSFDIMGSEKIWELIISVNKLRNHIAHDLPYHRDQKKIDTILNYSEIKKQTTSFFKEIPSCVCREDQEYFKLMLAFMYIFGFLHGRIEKLSKK